MTQLSLTKTETTLLTDAAGRGGMLSVPPSMKASSAQRLLGKLLKGELITAHEQDGPTEHRLTAAAYEAVGLTPPRLPGQPGAKGAAVLGLLGREPVATIDELMAATGWLPHTTRAALSRLRSGGTPLEKSRREDGRTAYRIVADVLKPARRARRPAASEPAEAAAA